MWLQSHRIVLSTEHRFVPTGPEELKCPARSSDYERRIHNGARPWFGPDRDVGCHVCYRGARHDNEAVSSRLIESFIGGRFAAQSRIPLEGTHRLFTIAVMRPDGSARSMECRSFAVRRVEWQRMPFAKDGGDVRCTGLPTCPCMATSLFTSCVTTVLRSTLIGSNWLVSRL